MTEWINVQVIYLGERGLFRQHLRLPAGSSVMQAVNASGVSDAASPGCIDPARLGIFSRRVAPDAPVSDGDRIEIYRPLTADPKDARRRRAEPAG